MKRYNYVMRGQYPGLDPFWAGTLTTQSSDPEAIRAEVESYVRTYLPEGFQVLKVELGSITKEGDQVVWEPSMRRD